MKKEKILFLYLKTGNGHFSIANSLSNFMNKEKFDCVMINPIENSCFFVKFIVQDFYNIVQLRFKFVFEFLYLLNKIKLNSKFFNFLSYLIFRKKVLDIIKTENPDKIVSVHFFINKSVSSAIKKLKLNIPFVILVTDPFTSPNVWFTDKNNKFIVSSELSSNSALSMRVEKKNVSILPVVLDKKYSIQLSNEVIQSFKKKILIDLNKKNILILSGGGGFPNGIKIFINIVEKNRDFQILVVCGSNKDMYNFVNNYKKINNLDNVFVFGFVDYVYDLISISDIVVTKGGTSAIFEILLSKKIPVIANYIWEQEKGNVDFVVNNKLGLYERKHKKIGLLVNELLNNTVLYQTYLNNIQNMQLKNGLNYVCEYIEKM